MGFSFELALRYMRSKKRAFVSVGTMFAILGVALGVAALATVISVTGGFRAQFREKVLGVNAHVLVLKYSSDFREYRKIMDQMKTVPGVAGIAPFVINPMMITHGERTATGVLLKGVDPNRVAKVLDLPRHIVRGSMNGLRLPDSKPPERRRRPFLDDASSSRGRNPQGSLDDAALPKKSVLAEIGKAIGADARSAGSPPSAPVPSAVAPSTSAAPAASALAPKTPAPPGSASAAPGLPAPNAAGSAKSSASSRPSFALEDDDVEPELDPSVVARAQGLPTGTIVPDGGYDIVLPDDDVLPTELDPVPCADPSKVNTLPGIIIGSTLAKNLQVDVGGCLQVTSPTIGFSYSSGTIRAPVAKQFRVIAVFDAGFDQYDSKLVYTDLHEAQAFYDSGDSVTGIEMTIHDIDDAKRVSRVIEERLSNGVYHTMDWEELNHGLFTALRIQQILMSLVLALIIIVAAFTVIATLIMMVLDKKKEIAVLKAMGATNRALLLTFVYQGGLIGVVGTAIGLLLGFGICKGLLAFGLPLDPKVYFISRLPVLVRGTDFLLVGIFALLVCLVATVWPALHAARLRPAEAFREN